MTVKPKPKHPKHDPKLHYDPKSKFQTRFPRIIWPVNPLSQIAATNATIAGIVQASAPTVSIDTGVASSATYIVNKTNVTDTQKQPYKPDGHYYSIDLKLAIGYQDKTVLAGFHRGVAKPALTADETDSDKWGRAWGNPLVDPSTNTLYLVKCTLQQLKIEPLLSGFKIRWTLPRGWLWADGYSALTTIETVSNPLVIIRRCISPNSLPKGTKGGFSASVVTMYPGY